MFRELWERSNSFLKTIQVLQNALVKKEDKEGSTCSGFRPFPAKLKRGSTCSGFCNLILQLKGVNICRTVTQNMVWKPEKTNQLTAVRGVSLLRIIHQGQKDRNKSEWKCPGADCTPYRVRPFPMSFLQNRNHAYGRTVAHDTLTG